MRGDRIAVTPVPLNYGTWNWLIESADIDLTGRCCSRIAGRGRSRSLKESLRGFVPADVATWIGPATATSTLFVVLTPDGLRAQSRLARRRWRGDWTAITENGSRQIQSTAAPTTSVPSSMMIQRQSTCD